MSTPVASRPVAALTVSVMLLAACGGDDGGSAVSTPSTPATPVTAAAPTSTPATTGAPRVSETSEAPVATTVATTVETTAATTVPPVDVAAEIEAVLADALAPGAIGWSANGVEIPPTAIVAAVRIPGRDDVLVGVGENLDGSPVDASAPFNAATLTPSLVRTVALQLVDEGTLDPTTTVDRWAPTVPNADRVTVQMLLENATGWDESGQPEPDPVLADLERVWTLREVVELRATMVTALAEPGTVTDTGLFVDTVLGLIVEEVTGRGLAELIHDRVAVPAGLDDTALGDGTTLPDGFRHGRLNINGAAVDTSAVPAVAYITYNQATNSVASTPTDLLDLLDAWHSGQLFSTDRTAAPDRFIPDPAGNPDTYVGVDVPFNGYCPCTDATDGIEVSSIGRKPTNPFSRNFIVRYSDGISVVINLNTGAVTDPADLDAVVQAVHDIASTAT